MSDTGFGEYVKFKICKKTRNFIIVKISKFECFYFLSLKSYSVCARGFLVERGLEYNFVSGVVHVRHCFLRKISS